MPPTPFVIDGLQYSHWDRALFEEMRAGGVACVHVTIAYWENARETLANIGRWNRLFERNADRIVPVRCAGDVERARANGRTGVVFGFQNCSPIEDDIALVEVFHQLGVRFMQLSYNNQSLLAGGCYEDDDAGISRFGRQAIDEMNRVGLVVDMSHSAERSTLEAIELSRRPIAITHANPRFFAPARRNKSDAVLRALGESGGMLGLSAYPFHLKDGSDCRLEDFCAMAARAAEMIGVEHLGLGTDLCQNQPPSVLTWMRNGRWARDPDYGEGSAESPGWPAPPAWFASNADFPRIAQGLRAQGFCEDEVAAIMGGNWLEFFARSFGPERGV